MQESSIIHRLVRSFVRVLKNPFLLFVYLGLSFRWVIVQLPYFRFIKDTRESETRITLSTWFIQKVIGVNRAAYWPMHHSSIVSYVKNVYAGVDTCPGYNPGCYIHAVNKIYIGDYTQIAPNVGLMSGNHDLYDFRLQSKARPIKIGKYCWIGMGAIILPEVELGDFTIVGAGAIVTRSFPDGHCVIVGNPARKLKDLDPNKCISFTTKNPYNGYISSADFELFRQKHLNI